PGRYAQPVVGGTDNRSGPTRSRPLNGLQTCATRYRASRMRIPLSTSLAQTHNGLQTFGTVDLERSSRSCSPSGYHTKEGRDGTRTLDRVVPDPRGRGEGDPAEVRPRSAGIGGGGVLLGGGP